MLAASGPGSAYSLDAADFPALLAALAVDGRTVIAPVVRDGALVLDVVRRADELPIGWTSVHEPGRYRLAQREDRAFFGCTVGPHTWRRFLDPPRRTVMRAQLDAAGALHPVPAERAEPRRAFLGVRPCDVAAMAIHDRVFLGGPWPDGSYAARRKASFVVVVHCTEPAGTCFCAAFGSGPKASQGFDLALTELIEDGRHVFLVEVGSEEGRGVASKLPLRVAGDEEGRAAAARISAAEAAMGRAVDAQRLRERIAASWESPRWESIAARCLGCANCTFVCPTCFCSTVEDRVGWTGREIERERRWDSCFTLGLTHIHGGSHRTSIASRYRQWLTHKLSTWHDQFQTPGCVGCGRCIAWCPAAIDIAEEARALAAAED